MKKNSNKGYTLLELIVVIAIMAVLLVTVGLSVNLVFSNKAKAASKEIYNMLGVSQNVGMSKDAIHFAISRNSEGEYTVGVAQVNGASDVKYIQSTTISNKVVITLNGTEMAAGTGYLLAINRSTGGFSGTYGYNLATGKKGSAVSKITSININGNTTYKIRLSYTNGKFFYED